MCSVSGGADGGGAAGRNGAAVPHQQTVCKCHYSGEKQWETGGREVEDDGRDGCGINEGTRRVEKEVKRVREAASLFAPLSFLSPAPQGFHHA